MLWSVVNDDLSVVNTIEWSGSAYKTPVGCVLVPNDWFSAKPLSKYYFLHPQHAPYAWAIHIPPSGPVQIDKYLIRHIHRFLLKTAYEKFCEEGRLLIEKLGKSSNNPDDLIQVATQMKQCYKCWLVDLSNLETIEQLIDSVPTLLKKYWKPDAKSTL